MLKSRVFRALQKIEWATLTDSQRLDPPRVYEILFVRMGGPTEEGRKEAVARLNPHFPSRNRLSMPSCASCWSSWRLRTWPDGRSSCWPSAPTQEEQMEYARSLRMLKTGWTPEQRKEYFSWFLKAAHFKGGNSFTGFMKNIKSDAVALLSKEEKAALKPILEAKVDTSTPQITFKPRPFVKKWTVAEAAPLVEKGLRKRDFDRGRTLFGAASCFACHRFDNEGG